MSTFLEWGAGWASVYAGGVDGVLLETWPEARPGMRVYILVPRASNNSLGRGLGAGQVQQGAQCRGPVRE